MKTTVVVIVLAISLILTLTGQAKAKTGCAGHCGSDSQMCGSGVCGFMCRGCSRC